MSVMADRSYVLAYHHALWCRSHHPLPTMFTGSHRRKRAQDVLRTRMQRSNETNVSFIECFLWLVSWAEPNATKDVGESSSFSNLILMKRSTQEYQIPLWSRRISQHVVPVLKKDVTKFWPFAILDIIWKVLRMMHLQEITHAKVLSFLRMRERKSTKLC